MTEWRDLELDEMSEWPLLPQCMAALMLAIFLMGLGYWRWLAPLNNQLEQQKQTELTLRHRLSEQARLLVIQPQISAQIVVLNQRYKKVVEQLPEQWELSSLLASINDVGVNNGLIFESIKWAPQVEHPLYYELPLNIELTGSYHQIGQFSEAVAKLPRIVNLTNLELRTLSSQSNNELLLLKVSATTYRFKRL